MSTAKRRWGRLIPLPMRRGLSKWPWYWLDAQDYLAEMIGRLPFHGPRLFLWRRLLGLQVGPATSLHRHCRFYRAQGIVIGRNSVVNRGVLLDGREGLTIGDNVSISEESLLLTLAHDVQSADFANLGGPVHIGDRVFIGTRAMVLPGVTVGEGAVVGAGAVVTRDVDPYTIVAGVPARPIGERSRDLRYDLDYRKFLG